MKGDFTRFRFDPSKRYARVLKQQGRVDLDADWNEAGAIEAYLDGTRAKDVIGLCGAPKKNGGFLVGPAPLGDLTLSAGRMYVDGLLCETDGTTYKKQPYLPHPPALDPKTDRVDLVYLDVWQRHVTAVEDPELLEEALGGADTTTRLQTVWQVKVRAGVEEAVCDGEFEPWPPMPPLEERGQLTTGVVTVPDEEDPCLIAPGGGYRGLENRLYRVEIHDGGQAYAWPRPAGAEATEVSGIANANEVTVADWSVDDRAWQVGQSAELYSDQTNAGGAAGELVRITALDESSSTLTLDRDVSSMTGHASIRLRRVATFKWSRDNGSVVFAIKEFVSGEPRKVRVKRLGRDQVLTLHANDWVEILGDETELKGQPGTLTAIAPGGIDEAELKLTLEADVSGHSGEAKPKVRRWDQRSAAIPVTTELLDLEDGVQIQFDGQDFQTGDYWTFAARTATGKVEELKQAPPQGIEHHVCRLALVTWNLEESEARTLVAFEDGKLVPDLVAYWEVSEDGESVVFKLRKGLTMPDGSDVTSEIVIEILKKQGFDCDYIDEYAFRILGRYEEVLESLSTVEIIGESKLPRLRIEDCRPAFPTLTEICAEDVCYDDAECDDVQAETVQEAIDQLCAMRDLRHHNQHLHGWGIVCGLQVTCGADDPELSGDRTTATVQPGYAIDCDGNDIVLEETMTLAVWDMIEAWDNDDEREKLLEAERGRVCLIIERDQHGQPAVALRPYDTRDNRLQAMLQGTLLMDFLQDCITEPLQEVRKILLPPAEAETGGKLVGPARRQMISLINLLVQIWNPQHGSHVYVSSEEHAILKALYYELRDVLQSETFCAMFDQARPFPDYPFEDARMSTIFDRSPRSRLRIDPKGRYGYALGLDNKLHVYELDEGELVTIVEVPGGEGLVAQDVAFSQDGKELYAIATLKDRDSIFAVADIDGLDHDWRPVTMICGVALLSLARARGFEKRIFAVGRGKGLYALIPGAVQPNIQPSLSFNAVGHLVIDHAAGLAYASARDPEQPPDSYDHVVEIRLDKLEETRLYHLHDQQGLAHTGDDDIAIVPAGAGLDLAKLCVVVDAPDKGGKHLFIFPVGSDSAPTLLPVPDTAIRLGHVPGSTYLMGTLEDHYMVGLVDVASEEAVGGFQLPVQIAPIAIASDPKGEWVYVVNGLSTTITRVAGTYMQAPDDQASTPGSAPFLEKLMHYRREVFMAFIDLVGGLLQHLKDCFCHHLLVNCPDCEEDDEVYLGCVTIQEGEVYNVCNFSRRKYVKSFPTIGYWLSLIPVAPLIQRAVEYACCLVLPRQFGRFVPPERQAYQPPVASKQLRHGYAAYYRTDLRAQLSEMTNRLNLTQRIAADWVGQAVAKAAAPMEPKDAVSGEEVVDEPVEEALKKAKEAQVEAEVKAYDPAVGARNVVRATRAPLHLQPGSRVTFYEKDGVVRYYSVAERPPEAVETLRTELEAQRETLAEVETLKSRLREMRTTLTSKDQELTALRGELEDVREKQASLEAAPELERVRTMETELEELRSFRDEVKLFMERSNE
jgi:hypothetical protein